MCNCGHYNPIQKINLAVKWQSQAPNQTDSKPKLLVIIDQNGRELDSKNYERLCAQFFGLQIFDTHN